MEKKYKSLDQLSAMANSRRNLKPGMFQGEDRLRVIKLSLTVHSLDSELSFLEPKDQHLSSRQKRGISPQSHFTEPE